MGTAPTGKVRTPLVTVVITALIASTVWWVLASPDFTVGSSANGVGAVSSGIGLALFQLVVFGVFTAIPLVLASRRGVVPAVIVRVQGVLTIVLVALLFAASERTEARINEAATAEPNWTKSPEAVNAEILLLNRDYRDAINAGSKTYERIAAVQLVAFWCALWAALQPDRQRSAGT